ncbi:hypothetical protein MBELCI_2976 [Limimaricola cinnabarinus LL-001]|uniref:Uncharacterized protein n=1 Tax=Limimaricola cinnabarinus LL-001 TaxID=1337093 RepID=U3AGX2_9RHOB|nr:hypothetical protein MBELCI_2976 [Limimaricola cinnabarinus LL-001]
MYLHHGFGNWHSLTDLAKRVARQTSVRQIVCYSRTGCGDSPARLARAEADYLRDEAHHVLPALLDA